MCYCKTFTNRRMRQHFPSSFQLIENDLRICNTLEGIRYSKVSTCCISSMFCLAVDGQPGADISDNAEIS